MRACPGLTAARTQRHSVRYTDARHSNTGPSSRNRSALDWVIDQYQKSTDKRSGIESDPNNPDDEEFIVRLVGQVVRLSVETVKIVNSLPTDYGETDETKPTRKKSPTEKKRPK